MKYKNKRHLFRTLKKMSTVKKEMETKAYWKMRPSITNPELFLKPH